METGDKTPGRSPLNERGDRENRRVSFEELVSQVTAELAPQPRHGPGDGITRCLGNIAGWFDADLIYLLLFSPDRSSLLLSHHWQPDTESQRQVEFASSRHLSIRQMPWLAEVLVPSAPTVVQAGSERGLVLADKEAATERMELAIPLRHEGRGIGVMRVHLRESRSIPCAELVRRFTVLAEVLSSPLAEFSLSNVTVRAEVGAAASSEVPELGEHERTYRLMSKQIGQVLYEWDLATGRVFWSGAIEEVTGYQPGELGSATISDREAMIHPDDRQAVVEALGRAVETDGRYSAIYRLVRKEGRYIYAEDRGTVMRDGHGGPVRMLGTLKDISARFHTLAAIRASEEKYRSIFESFQDIFYRATLDGEIVLVSPSVYQKLGYRPDEVIGRQATDFYADDPSVRRVMIELLLRQSQISDFELRMRTKDGRILEVSVSAHLLRDAAGQVTGYEGVLRDISDRKKAEAILKSLVKGTASRTGRQFFRALVQSMSEGLGCRYVHVGEWLNTGNRVRTLAYWNGGRFERNFEYTLDRPDCTLVQARTMCTHARRLPDDRADYPCMSKPGVKSFVGAPLIGSQENLLGFLMVMDDQEIPDKLVEQTQSLITIAAARAAAELERLKADQALQQTVSELRLTTEKLRLDHVTLTEKNIALKTILEHIEQEREGYRAEICASLEQALMPYVRKLQEGNGRLSSRDLGALTELVASIVGQGVDSFKVNYPKLSPRETEICELIMEGHPSKDISDILGISVETIHKHREIIRRKLRIQHLDINLSTYLRSKLR